MATGNKRRRYIVDKQQYKVSAIIILYNVTAIFLTGLIIFLPSFIGMSSATDSLGEAASAREILVLHKRFWPAAFIVAFILGAHSIFYFHRLFGPLYRFKSVLKKIANGDVSFSFEIRRKDFFASEKEGLNEVLTSLRKSIGELKQESDLLVSSLHQLDVSLDDQDTTTDEVRRQVSEMRRAGERLTSGFDGFKLD